MEWNEQFSTANYTQIREEQIMLKLHGRWNVAVVGFFLAPLAWLAAQVAQDQEDERQSTDYQEAVHHFDRETLLEGKIVFRYDTFGDKAFWGGTLKLHQAIERVALGGVGPGISPNTALAVGLKVDVDALPPTLVSDLRLGQINLDDHATTLALLRLNAVLGVPRRGPLFGPP
jgi:hypothetical protein